VTCATSVRSVTATSRPGHPADAPPLGRGASLLRVGVVYVLALGALAAWLLAGPSTGRDWLDVLLADVAATLVVFAGSRALGNSSVYDSWWSVAPPALLLAWWLMADLGDGDPRSWLLALVVSLWAVRLTGNWLYSWPGLHHEDWRYPILRERGGPAAPVVDLLAIHLVPTLQVFLGTVPAYVVLTRAADGTAEPFGVLDVVALLVGLVAVTLELVSDVQMHRFARTKQPGEVMERGLWAWSRHPNYLGEVLFWVSVALFGIAAAPDQWWWLPLGAVGMLAMFLLVSIPWMDERSLERRPAYADVVERVPALLPRRPRR